MTAPTAGKQLTVNSVPGLSPMRNKIRDYDWGSTSALARLQHRVPSGAPEAELWMGAHPAAPSDLLLAHGRAENDGEAVLPLPLPDVVARFPQQVLGSAVLSRFGVRLPFLLKVLAIARPLSVQVHPDAARAKAVYRPDGSSPYVDPYPKPELLYALEPTEALFGFRPPAQAAMLIGRLGCGRLGDLVAGLTGERENTAAVKDDPQRLHDALATLLRWPVQDRAALVAEIAGGSSRLLAEASSDYPEAFGWLDRLVGLHPTDPMVLAPLLLDVVRLSPGQTIFVPAGVPHCYLSGLGVEILAASDNVLRCGLTSKPIDVEELLEVIDCRPLPSSGPAATALGEHELAWRPAEDFQLSRICLDDAEPRLIEADRSIAGPQIVLCTRGAVELRTSSRRVSLTSGFSAFVTAEAGPLWVIGDGEIFRAAAGSL